MAQHKRWQSFLHNELKKRNELDRTPLANAQPVSIVIMSSLPVAIDVVLCRLALERLRHQYQWDWLMLLLLFLLMYIYRIYGFIQLLIRVLAFVFCLSQLPNEAPPKPLRSGMSTADPRQLVTLRHRCVHTRRPTVVHTFFFCGFCLQAAALSTGALGIPIIQDDPEALAAALKAEEEVCVYFSYYFDDDYYCKVFFLLCCCR